MSRYTDSVAAVVLQSDRHLTAEQIFLEMKKEYPKVVLATIYNNLNRLTNEGRIRKVSVEGEPDRYDRTTRHDHLICEVCKSLADVTLEDFTKKIEEQLGEDIVSYDLKIQYICPNCRKNRVNGQDSPVANHHDV
ncbi:MAG: transcriptional repressor [bacterium]|nr:transcriptional repressor [bacterium]